MEDDLNEMAEGERSSLTRRRLIQAGVATGVAAAVWASPQVRVVQAVPPDGFNCTAPLLKLTSGSENVNCRSGCPDYVTYLSSTGTPLSVTINGPTGSGVTGTIQFGDVDARCSNYVPGLGAPVSIDVSDPNLTCWVSLVSVFIQGGGQNPPPVAGTAPGYAPPVPRVPSNACSARIEIEVECCPKNSFHENKI